MFLRKTVPEKMLIPISNPRDTDRTLQLENKAGAYAFYDSRSAPFFSHFDVLQIAMRVLCNLNNKNVTEQCKNENIFKHKIKLNAQVYFYQDKDKTVNGIRGLLFPERT